MAKNRSGAERRMPGLEPRGRPLRLGFLVQCLVLIRDTAYRKFPGMTGLTLWLRWRA